MKYFTVALPWLAVLFCGSLAAQETLLSATPQPSFHDVYFDAAGEARIKLTGLAAGDVYEVALIQHPENPIVMFSSVLPATAGLDTPGLLRGTADGTPVRICLDAVMPGLPSIRVSVVKNKVAKPSPPLPEKLASVIIQTEETNDTDFLLNTVFRQDTCFELTPGSIFPGTRRPRSNNGTFDGFFGQTGIFRNGRATIGIDSGIIITSGWVQDAPGPNDPSIPQTAPVSFFTTYNGTDPDADALVPGNVDIYDLVILDFDFIPTTDTISFNYVFFSEQYCANLNGNDARDAFGFILTAPDGTTQNIARLPVSGDIVSPATLNPTTPDAASFLPNTTPMHPRPCSPDPAPADRLAGIGYDGFSTVLTARGAVTPCAPHNLKIIVLDGNDALLDSGLFLEAGSFLASLVNKPEPTTTAEIERLTPVEGCDTALIRFTRRTVDSAALARPLLVKYNIIPILDGSFNEAVRATDPNNTAGADYLLQESPFFIPVGDTAAVLRIPILADSDFNEGIEAFVIRYDGTCNCSENADTFYIMDNVDLEIDLGPDLSECAGVEVVLEAGVVGGNGTYFYDWRGLGADSSRIAYTTTGRDTTLIVNVADACGLMGSDTIFIGAPAISGTIGGDFSLCGNETAEVAIDVEGSALYRIVLRVDSAGVTTNTEYVITGDTIFRFTETADVTLVSVEDANGCGGSALGTARVRTADVSLSAAVEPDPCNQSLGAIRLTTADGNDNFTFTWADAPSLNTGIRENLSAGTYRVEIMRNGTNCPDNREFVVQSGSPLAVSIQATAPACPGESFVLSPIVTGGVGAYTFSWPDSLTTDSLLTVTSGGGFRMYMVEVSDSCGNMRTAAFTTNIESFSASVAGRYSLCNVTPASVDLRVTGPVDNYTVVLSVDSAGVMTTRTVTVPSGSSTIDFNYAATVSVAGIVRNSNTCAGAVAASSAVVVDPQIRFNATVGNVRCAGETNGRILLADVATIPVNYAWSDGGFPGAERTDLAAGVYRVTITDAADASCSRDTTIVVTQPDPLSLTVTGSGLASCPGQMVELFPVVSGGSLPYTFDWDNGATADSLYRITTEGGVRRYPVSVTDACGVTVRDTVVISVGDTRAEVSGTFSVCNAPFTAEVPVSFTGTGPFTFTIEENGVARTLVLRGSNDTTLVYNAATTIRLLSVTGNDGCAGIAGGIANVTDANFNVASAIGNIACAGDMTGSISVVVNGNNNLYDFSWSTPGASGPSLTNLPAGVYGLTVTDGTSAACSWDTSFVLTEPASRITRVRDSMRDESCSALAYAAAEYAGGTGTLVYTWSNNTAGPVLGEVPAGLYELTVTDDNGCTVVQPFNLVDQRTTVLANIFQSAAELSCTQPSLELSVSQNTQIVTWEWLDADRNPIGTQRQQTVTTAGRYYVTITNPANGCSATDSIDVVASEDLVVLDLLPEALITCANDAVDFTVTTSFTGEVDYEWTFGGAVVGTSAGLTDVSATGVYEVKVTRRDNGCESFASTEVRIDREAPVVSVPTPLVTSSCRTPVVSFGVVSSADFAYSWTTTDGNFLGAGTTPDLSVDRPGTYRVRVTNQTNGCSTEADVTVVADGEVLAADAGPDQPLVCNGAGTVLTASFSPRLPGTEVIWFDPSGSEIGAERQVSTLTAGAHVVEVVHPESGCSSFDTVLVMDQAPTLVTYTLQQPPCPEVGGRLFVNEVIGLNGPFTYSSPTGETEPFGTGLRGLRVGTNVLEVTDQLGCVLRDTFQVFEGGTFEGTGPDVEVRLGEEAQLGVRTNRTFGQLASWTWLNLKDTLACTSCPAPTVLPLESFVAQVTVVDTNGCEVVIRQNVVVEEPDLIYLPNAFSPNGDGTNDVYRVFGNESLVTGVNWLRIFDRWGNLMFEATDFALDSPNSVWDGNGRNGQPALSGVYTYNVSYQRYDDVPAVVTGSFTLLR